MKVQDNFLNDEHLNELDSIINNPQFAWFLQDEQIQGADDGIWFSHRIYDTNTPLSSFYNPVSEIFKDYFRYISLCRITVNCLPRQDPPSISAFHTDFDLLGKVDEEKITTAIFYLNTNNGATEIENESKVDCVSNRLLMFPATTFHRAIGQTDINKRIVLNFNFVI